MQSFLIRLNINKYQKNKKAVISEMKLIFLFEILIYFSSRGIPTWIVINFSRGITRL